MKMDGVYLLDREMDADHNRCVITLVGDPVNVAEAAIRGVGKAAELIDLTKHTGAHPRLGAADVIPFIPIEGVTLEDCVAIARRVGEEIWKRYKVPVYLYEAAAQKPGAPESGKRPARPVRRHSRRDQDQSCAQARFWRRRTPSHGRRDRRRRAQVSGRLQRLPQHARRGDRQEDWQGRALLQRRTALREGHGRERCAAWRRSR